MISDLERIRAARFFKDLPEHAFQRVMSQVRLASFDAGQTVVEFPSSTSGDYGFVVSGAVFFMSSDQRPMGLSLRDEFFLTRPFTLHEKAIATIVAVQTKTLVVFVPKAVIVALTKIASSYAHIIDDIYDSIFERTRTLLHDETSRLEVQAWIKHSRFSEVNRWIERLERKREEESVVRAREDLELRRYSKYWNGALFVGVLLSSEVLLRWLNPSQSLLSVIWPRFGVDVYRSGSVFVVLLGIFSFVFLLISQAMVFAREGLRRNKWKLNDRVVRQVLMVSVSYALLLAFLHRVNLSGGELWAIISLTTIMAAALTAYVSETVARQIPLTLKGDRLRLENLSEQRDRLRDRLTIIVPDPEIFKTAWGMLESEHPRSAVGHLAMAPFMWLRSYKVKRFLRAMGIADESATVAVKYLVQEFLIAQRLHFLGALDRIVARWMLIQIPIGIIAVAANVVYAASSLFTFSFFK